MRCKTSARLILGTVNRTNPRRFVLLDECLLELGFLFVPLWQNLIQQLIKPFGMILVPEMAQLVRNNVIDAIPWCTNQVPV